MATLIRDRETLVLQLTTLEKAEGLHGDLRIPWSAVQSITVLEDAIAAVHGLKAPGTGIPGIVAVGTYWGRDGRTLAVVHHQTRRGVKVTLKAGSFGTLIIGAEDAEGVVRALETGASEDA